MAKADGPSEANSEMARRGFHYDRSAVAHALIELVKDGILTKKENQERLKFPEQRTERETNVKTP